MNRLRRSCFLAVFGACASAAAAVEPEAVLQQIRAAALDPERAVTLGPIEIDMGLGVLRVESGHLVPARAIAGRTAEMAFVGRARFVIDPPDTIEADQLELFTGERKLDAEITSAVLVLGDAAVSEALLARPRGALDAEVLRSAEARFAAWVEGAERAGIGADAAVFRSVLGDPVHRRYFTAVLESDDLGRFFYLFDPEELEPVTLGQFVPLELDDAERHQAEHAIRRSQRTGRWIGLRLEDLGDWNTWLRTAPRGADGLAREGGASFEPTKYAMHVTIDPGESRIVARAQLDLVAQAAGARALVLSLYPDLRVSAVRDRAGTPLTWFRSGRDVHVVLPEGVSRGDSIRLDVSWSGVVLEQLEKGVLRLSDTYSWYPRTGTDDRAKYDVTLRRPKRHELLASGRVVETREEEGQTSERRVYDIPVSAFSFEVGAFDVVHEQVGHVALTVGFSKSTLPQDSGAREAVLETLRGALAFYEAAFGPYPLDHLAVATVPRDFSQGFLGFLTLSHYLLARPAGWYVNLDGGESRSRSRIETVAHELAHQWWGGKVAWISYRDQWLSEALADYSAVRYAAARAERRATYLTRHAADWQARLRATTRDGRTVESLGPVVLGQRLRSSLSDAAYSAVVYDKGSVVFTMLAAMLEPDKMNDMLRELATRAAHRSIDTATFLKSLERMSGTDLSTFSRQFVFGTGAPEIYYGYRIGPAAQGNGWVIEGEARMIAPQDYRYALRQDGGWDVTRERVSTVDVADWALLVPFQVKLAEPEGAPARDTERWVNGSLVLRGSHTPFSVPLPQRPAGIELDRFGQVLGYFFCENNAPKRTLVYRAMELEGDEAAALLERALATPLLSENDLAATSLSPKEIERREKLLDADVHLLRARLQLDRRDTGAARASLKTVEQLLGGLEGGHKAGTRSFLAARAALQEGDYEAAYREGRKLWLTFPRQETDSMSEDLRRNRWRSGRQGNGEDYAVLAVAAFETGRLPVARRALEVAEERGSDMGLLRRRLGSP